MQEGLGTKCVQANWHCHSYSQAANLVTTGFAVTNSSVGMCYRSVEHTKSLSIELSGLPSSEVGGIGVRCTHILPFPVRLYRGSIVFSLKASMRLQSPRLWPNRHQLAQRMGWSLVSGSFRPARGAADGLFDFLSCLKSRLKAMIIPLSQQTYISVNISMVSACVS